MAKSKHAYPMLHRERPCLLFPKSHYLIIYYYLGFNSFFAITIICVVEGVRMCGGHRTPVGASALSAFVMYVVKIDRRDGKHPHLPRHLVSS